MTKIKILIEEKYKVIVFLFFAAYLGIGLVIFKDYGIPWDEPWLRHIGGDAVLYILNLDQSYLTDPAKYHGQIFEMLLIAIEAVLNLTDSERALFFMRHLVTFLSFYIGVIFFYLLCKYRFHSWKIGLLGCLFLILSPRIFAHSFYNSKDLTFLAMFIISMYTLLRYLDKKTLQRAAIHAVACALLVDIRILGIIVPLFTVSFLIGDSLIIKTEEIKGTKIIESFLIYTLLLISFTILFWPILWANPLYHFIEAFKELSRFPWRGKTLLYLGDYIKVTNLPWHYIPVWIIITTPVFYVICFFIGSFISIKSLVMNPIQFYANKRNDIIFILWFFLPLGIVILIRSVLYDGWRHMFFIYPAFLILSLTGLISLFNFFKTNFQGMRYRIINATFILVAAFSLIITAQSTVKLHPYQNVYFNRLAGKNMKEIKNNFELDYWGLSYRKALEYVLENNPDEAIKIYVANHPGKENARILKPDGRNRLIYVDNPDEAEYFLSNYRWHKEEYPYKNEYYSIKIDEAKIMVVYKIN